MIGLVVVTGVFSTLLLLLFAFGNVGTIPPLDFTVACFGMAFLMALALLVDKKNEHD